MPPSRPRAPRAVPIRVAPRCPPGRARGVAAAAGAVLAAALLLACRDPTAGPGRHSGRGPPPVYTARRAPSPPRIDGRLDDEAWSAALPVHLVETLTGRAPRQATQAWVTWDAEALYAAFRCDDDEPWVRPGRRDDDPIYEDEVVELFLDRGGTGRDYVELEVSPANVRFDARFARYRSDLATAVAWSSGMRSAVAVEGELTVGDAPPRPARGWTVELALPWAAVGGPPRGGERWRINLYRLEARGRGGPEGSGLSPPLRGDFHALDRFARLELWP